jgi:predicted acyl esterase
MRESDPAPGRLSKGSRLRLVLHSPNSIYLQKNYNSGGVVAEETASDARTAHISLHHDAEHPSFLELPIDDGTGRGGLLDAARHP